MEHKNVKLPFKNGDLVALTQKGEFQFDWDRLYVVDLCIVSADFPSGFRVDLQDGGPRWDSGWFTLAKSTIINQILKEI